MKDKKPFKQWAREIQRALCLDNWRLSFAYYDEPSEKEETLATMHCNPQYFEMRLSIYPGFYKQAETAQFEILLHEFCHVLTEELYRTACAFAEGKNYHQESLETTRERNTTMIQLAATSLMGNTSLRKIYDKLNNSKHHNKQKTQP